MGRLIGLDRLAPDSSRSFNLQRNGCPEPNPDSLSLWVSRLRHLAVTLAKPRRSV
jgi:hypothetical protein